MKSASSPDAATRALEEGRGEQKERRSCAFDHKKSEYRKNVDEDLLVTRVGVSLRVMPLPQQAESGFLSRLQMTFDHLTKALGGLTCVSAPVG